MPEYVLRMKEELELLSFRLMKLNDFMDTPRFYDLEETDRKLMAIQFHVMNVYKNVLIMRIERSEHNDSRAAYQAD